jgi:1,4-alpha-glucan branching enzyme
MATTRRVEFVLEMPAARVVHVAGTFNNWDPKRNSLQKGPDGLWRTRVWMPAGPHEYRFVVDGEWISDPKAARTQPNAFGSTNSVLEA